MKFIGKNDRGHARDLWAMIVLSGKIPRSALTVTPIVNSNNGDPHPTRIAAEPI